VFVDVDDDGWIDLVVATTRCHGISIAIFTRHVRRRELPVGFGADEEGLAQASMGIAVGDYNEMEGSISDQNIFGRLQDALQK